MHILFILGLLLLGAAVLEAGLVRMFNLSIANGESRAIPLGWLLSVLALGALCTLLTPYHVHLYADFLRQIRQSALMNEVAEMRAMTFRSLPDFVVLATVAAAAFALGWRRRTRLWLLLVFPGALYLGFSFRRKCGFRWS